MEKRELNHKTVIFLVISIISISFFSLGSNALNITLSFDRINLLKNNFDEIERKIFVIEVNEIVDKNLFNNVYFLFNDADETLKIFKERDLISEEDFQSFEKKLVNLKSLFSKSIENKLPNQKVLFSFCENESYSCEISNHVLNYVSYKFDNVFVFKFNSKSTHPFVNLVFEKTKSYEIPTLYYNNTFRQGVVSFDELLAFLEIEQ